MGLKVNISVKIECLWDKTAIFEIKNLGQRNHRDYYIINYKNLILYETNMNFLNHKFKNKYD